jgi:hypothetical protein
MAFNAASYVVQYNLPSPGWNLGWSSLMWRQSVNSEIGQAVHVFQTQATDQSSGETFTQLAIEDLVSSLTQGMPLTFTVTSLDGSLTSPKQYHVVDSWELHIAPKVGATLVVTTLSGIAMMNVDRRNRTLSTTSVTDALSTIMGNYSGQLTLGAVEQSDAIPEFAKLRQSNVTDYQFIIEHLIPRAIHGSVGGYDLVSVDGKLVRFASPSYQINQFTVPPEQLIDVREQDNSFAVTRAGGGNLIVNGFNHYQKKSLTTTIKAAQITPSYGSTGMSMVGERVEYVPFASQLAVNAWARARFAEWRTQAYLFDVLLRGDPVSLNLPSTIDLSGTKYRNSDNQSGVIVEVLHDIRKGKYEMTLSVERDAWNP